MCFRPGSMISFCANIVGDHEIDHPDHVIDHGQDVRVGVDLVIGKQGSCPRRRDGGPMARRTFDVIDICEIFTQWHAGRSKNEIAGSLGLSRNTVRSYLAAAEAAGSGAGRPGGVAGGVGPAGAGVVPGACRCAAAAGDVAGDRGAPGPHRRAAGRGGDDGHDSPASCVMSGGWRRRSRRCAGMWRRTCRRRPTGRRSRYCGWCRPSRALKRRSTTGGWAAGSIRGRGAGMW